MPSNVYHNNFPNNLIANLRLTQTRPINNENCYNNPCSDHTLLLLILRRISAHMVNLKLPDNLSRILCWICLLWNVSWSVFVLYTSGWSWCGLYYYTYWDYFSGCFLRIFRDWEIWSYERYTDWSLLWLKWQFLQKLIYITCLYVIFTIFYLVIFIIFYYVIANTINIYFLIYKNKAPINKKMSSNPINKWPEVVTAVTGAYDKK